MSNLRSLNNLFFLFVLLWLLKAITVSKAETVEIWNNNSNNDSTLNEIQIENQEATSSSSLSLYETIKPLTKTIHEEQDLKLEKKRIFGLFDPEENDLDIDMWVNSDEEVILRQLKKIENMKFSKDVENMFLIALFTNSNLPITDNNSNSFLDYKSNWLIKEKKNDLIKKYLEKNPNLKNSSNLIEYLINENISNFNISKACEKLNFLNKENKNLYLNKFKIYCLINKKKIDEAQLQYDLLKENGINDKFFDNKINFLLGYAEKPDNSVSEENLFYFHLSHVVNNDFQYEPSDKTSKYIWKYLSSANLIFNFEEFDLENEEKIVLLEKAVADESLDSKKLFDLYKKFLFNINYFLDLEKSYRSLPNYKARALLYQAVLIADNLDKKFYLINILNNLFKKDNISNVFNKELTLILLDIDKNEVPEGYLAFYEKNINIKEKELKKIKYDKKIIHRSKLLKHFIDDNYNTDNISEDLLNIYKKVKKDKKYFFSLKDIILLESLKADGIEIPKKLSKLYSIENLTIPTELIILSHNNESGMTLLKIIEIIGEDKFSDLDDDTLYFIIITLNKLELRTIRNNIIFKTLPERI